MPLLNNYFAKFGLRNVIWFPLRENACYALVNRKLLVKWYLIFVVNFLSLKLQSRSTPYSAAYPRHFNSEQLLLMKALLSGGGILLLSVLALPSCKKEAMKESLVTSGCRIKQLIFKTQSQKDKSGTFTYNTNGDPVSYTPTGFGNGSLKYEFRYDAGGHLTDYIGYDPTAIPASCDFWIKYSYDKHGRIAKDSVYYNCNYGPALVSFANYFGTTEYKYDGHDRITSVVYKQFYNNVPNGVTGYYKYNYNGSGNLVTPGAVYDDKTSIYRTSKIWMFLGRNYSVNNLKPAISYNANGLPAAFAATAARGAEMRMLDIINLSDCEILYECSK